jgi:hypothetical protein
MITFIEYACQQLLSATWQKWPSWFGAPSRGLRSELHGLAEPKSATQSKGRSLPGSERLWLDERSSSEVFLRPVVSLQGGEGEGKVLQVMPWSLPTSATARLSPMTEVCETNILGRPRKWTRACEWNTETERRALRVRWPGLNSKSSAWQGRRFSQELFR